jgi:hypothetical protein
MCVVSLKAGVKETAVIWCCVPYGDANKQLTGCRLIAYDGSNIGRFPDGGGRMLKLWDSQDWNHQFLFNKFDVPIVWNGQLFVPTYDARVLVYGLA